MSKVFITGGSGFLGNNLFERLGDDDVYLYERGEGFNGLMSFGPDIIIHAAGEIYQEGKMFNSNVKLTYLLLESSRMVKNLQAFIYIGTSSEYGRKTKPFKETDTLEPTNLYEATKGAGTLLTVAFAKQYGLPAVVARPFSLYGPGDPDFRFIPKAIQAAKAGWEFPLAPGVHDWIYVDDFITGILDLTVRCQPGEIYNFGSGVQSTNEEVLELIEEIVGRKTKRVLVEKMKPYDSDCWVADISKAKKIGWKPRFTLREGLVKLIKGEE